MEDKFNINLADWDVGHEELDWLLKEWQKDPKPKTINDLARILLTHRYEAETGHYPYDSFLTYNEKDKIKVRTVEGFFALAEVVSVVKNGYYDRDGFTGDLIYVRILSQEAKVNRDKIFVANYKGNKFHASANFEVIGEKDIADVIPKLLLALENDKRFCNFCEYWLPSDLLVTNISTMLTDIKKIIAKSKQPLSTYDILNSLYPDNNKEELGERLLFSLNHFLEKDKKLFRLLKPMMKWDLRESANRILLAVDRGALLNGKLLTTSDLDLMILYHRFVGLCTFSFPNNHKITAYHDISEGSISGEEFIGELVKLSQNSKHEVEFISSKLRGDHIKVCIPVPTLPEKRRWTVTIKPEWLEEGVLKVSRELSTYIGKTDTIHVLYDQIDELLPYDHNDKLIKELVNYYTKKAIAEGDKVHLLLQSIGPAKLFLNCRWQRRLERLLQIEPTDLKWENISLRDCIIVVLAKFETPAHYREIYTEIAIHKHVSLGSVIGTLSRYCPTVFAHVGWGKWVLAGFWVEQKIMSEREQKESPEIAGISDEVWEAVATIEEKDYVYKLLDKIRKPLSFDEICNKLAKHVRVHVNQLRATSFLKADDERFRRLDDGTWALEEWSARDKGQGEPVEDHDEEPGVEETGPEDVSKYSRSLLLLIIFLILLFSSVAVGSILIWLFFLREINRECCW